MNNVPSNRLVSKYFAIRHKTLVRLLSGIMPYYVVNEYPKSGGTWLAQMISQALHLPFESNKPLRFEPCVTHGHFLHPFCLKNVVVVWRDPRDVIVSYYHHCFFLNEHNNASLVKLMKNRLPFNDYRKVKENLPEFIRFVSGNPVSPPFTWPEFAAKWALREDVIHTSYERLRANTATEISRIVRELAGFELSPGQANKIASDNSFVKAKQRARNIMKGNTELSFVRKGSLGGWTEYFDREAREEISAYEKWMEILGYPV